MKILLSCHFLSPRFEAQCLAQEKWMDSHAFGRRSSIELTRLTSLSGSLFSSSIMIVCPLSLKSGLRVSSIEYGSTVVLLTVTATIYAPDR